MNKHPRGIVPGVVYEEFPPPPHPPPLQTFWYLHVKWPSKVHWHSTIQKTKKRMSCKAYRNFWTLQNQLLSRTKALLLVPQQFPLQPQLPQLPLQTVIQPPLLSWINHLPPACWSTFWKSNFKQQLGCRFDIMDNKSYFLCFDICNYICLDTSGHFSVLPS